MPSYPWGDELPTCDLLVSGLHCGVEKLAAVGSKPAGVSPYGAMDMAGSVLEWVEDCFTVDNYTDTHPVDGTAFEPAGGCGEGVFGSRELRGGSAWAVLQPQAFKSEARLHMEQVGGAWDRGWRCCRDLSTP